MPWRRDVWFAKTQREVNGCFWRYKNTRGKDGMPIVSAQRFKGSRGKSSRKKSRHLAGPAIVLLFLYAILEHHVTSRHSKIPHCHFAIHAFIRGVGVAQNAKVPLGLTTRKPSLGRTCSELWVLIMMIHRSSAKLASQQLTERLEKIMQKLWKSGVKCVPLLFFGYHDALSM